jgi:hypothetical protein
MWFHCYHFQLGYNRTNGNCSLLQLASKLVLNKHFQNKGRRLHITCTNTQTHTCVYQQTNTERTSHNVQE